MTAPVAVTLSPAMRAASGLINLAVAEFGNYDTDLCGLALEAAEAGRGAFWTRAGYSHQVAKNFCRIANASGIAAALKECRRPGNIHTSAAALVATLVPLNQAAAAAVQHWHAEAPWIDAGARLEAAE